MRIRTGLCVAALAASFGAAGTPAKPLRVPFDFSRSEIGVNATIKRTPVYVLIDTGVDPSVIDLKRAYALHQKMDLHDIGEGTGTGSGKPAAAYPATIDGLAIGGRAFGPIEALATDVGPISAHYGRRLDAVLGYSFLKDKIVLVDYPAHTVTFLDGAGDARALTKRCRTHWTARMDMLKDENWPLITQFRIGAATFPATLDTGSNSAITLYKGAPDLPGMRAALASKGATSSTGFQGKSDLKTFTLNAPAGFGPFLLPPGETVTLRDVKGSSSTSFANIGNKLFAALTPKMLLDYRAHTETFFGQCTPGVVRARLR
ncbi:MAG TPA: retropepsin-like aspartic protease [Rhizomicrobium sp.]|nr:retropepsin-like aspartic protease [Rhizomicrobium sp.]